MDCFDYKIYEQFNNDKWVSVVQTKIVQYLQKHNMYIEKCDYHRSSGVICLCDHIKIPLVNGPIYIQEDEDLFQAFTSFIAIRMAKQLIGIYPDACYKEYTAVCLSEEPMSIILNVSMGFYQHTQYYLDCTVAGHVVN